MKIGIVGMSNLFLMPYLFIYTRFLQKKDIDFDVIYWNRRDLDEKADFNTYPYNVKIKDSSTKVAKLKDFLGYTQFVKRILKLNNYDFIIVLTSLPAVLLSDFLCKNHSGNYIIDVRDYTYEHIFVYNKLLEKALSNSALNVISSPGFIELLPYKHAVLCHNLSFSNDGNKAIRSSQSRNVNPIRVSYVGCIAYYNQCLKFINAIANDIRFEFHLYGIGDYNFKIEKYCEDERITNVFMHGAYQPEEKEAIYRKTDIIFNAYGNGSNLLKYALSNKFYDAAWYNIPILVMHDTEMRVHSKSLSFPIACDVTDLANEIYQWYESIDWQVFQSDAQTIIDKAYSDNEKFYTTLNSLFTRGI